MNLSGIDWVVVGGESGPGARPMKKEWVVNIQRQCREQNVHFFFKQWGGVNKKKTGRRLNGRIYDAMPSLPDGTSQFDLSRRQYQAILRGRAYTDRYDFV